MEESHELPRAAIEEFCRKWKISELTLIGSGARGQLRPDSDLDFLVTWDDDAHWSLLDHVGIAHELGDLLGRKVDLVDRKGLESSTNHPIRDHILHGIRSPAPPGGTWRDAAVLIKLHQAVARACDCLRGIDAASFRSEPMRRDATLLQLIRMGAATERLSEQFRVAHPEVAWNELLALSELGSQMPDEWDLDYVWFVASHRVPVWLSQIEPWTSPRDVSP